MKTALFMNILGLAAVVSAIPASRGLWPRGCKPGTLVCNGDSKFGICDINTKAVWMSVSDGTRCTCSGAVCTIADKSTGAPIPVSSSLPSVPTSSQPAAPTSPFKTNPESDPLPAPAPAPEPDTAMPSSPPAFSITVGVHNASPSSDVSQDGPPPAVTPANTPTPSSTPAPDTSSPEASSSPQAPSTGSGTSKSYLKTFLGNGSPSQGWPEMSQWASFENMWSSSLGVISQSCSGFGQDNNSDEETASLKSAIQQVAKSSGVDARFILAIVMQESNGCVRAPTTNYGVTNPGLMQSHDGSHSCFNVSPCSSDEILGMITDGTEGTSSGPGLKQSIKSSSDVSDFYKAARMYNSGSIASTGMLQDGIATHCYASDIANRLLGWGSGPSGCHIS